jgi:Xaa-Pro aminopeptidase
MKTMAGVLIRGCTRPALYKISREEYQQRLVKVQAGMAAKNIGTLVVYGDTLDYGNMCYLSGWVPKEGYAFLIVNSTGDPVLVVSQPSRDMPYSKTINFIEDIRTLSPKDRLEDIIRSTASGEIRFSGPVDRAPHKLIAQAAGIGKPFETDREVIESFRKIKSKAEIEIVLEAAELAKECINKVCGKQKYETENQLYADLSFYAKAGGAQDLCVMINIDDPCFRPPENRLLPGKFCIVQLYLAICIDRYWCDMTVQFDCKSGKLSQRPVDGISDVAISLIKPGTVIGDINSLLQKISGLMPYRYISGIGLSLEEEPVSFCERLEENMLLSAFIPDTKGTVYKRLILTTQNGCKILI